MLTVEVISLPEKGTESYPESQNGDDDVRMPQSQCGAGLGFSGPLASYGHPES